MTETKNTIFTEELISNSFKQKIESEITSVQSGQKIEMDGKIGVPKKAWILIFSTICALIGLISYTIIRGVDLGDPFVLYPSLMIIDALLCTTYIA